MNAASTSSESLFSASSSQSTSLPPGYTTTGEGEYINAFERLSDPGYDIPEISTGAFLELILPPLKNGIVNQEILSSLREEGLFESTDAWYGPEDDRTTRVNQREGEPFEPISNIFNGAVSAATRAVPRLERTTRLIPVQSRSRQFKRLPSAYLSPDDSGCYPPTSVESDQLLQKFSWANVACTAEFKFGVDGESWSNTVHNRLVLDMQQIMTCDPRRRFVFGITIVERIARLWFCSRGTPVVSRPIDVLREPDILIHTFLSLAFASREELGWDPTIREVMNLAGDRAYHLDVGDSTYETLQPLSDAGVEELTGHATRVWKARRLGSDELYVIKDVWVEDGRVLEHALLDAILNDLREKYGTDIQEQVASHLLIPAAHWLVPVGNEEDHTSKVMMRGFLPQFKERLKIRVGFVDDPDSPGTEEPANDTIIQDAERIVVRAPLPLCRRKLKVVHRRHYRVLFKEVAQALYATRNLSDIFTVLSDSADVLKWIHGCGWVHRDISAGNLFLYDGRGLIGDFEYAKRRQTDVRHEFRIGTSDFMSVEASRRFYSHRPDSEPGRPEFGREALPADAHNDIRARPRPKRSVPFFHNDLHDLESLWWIAIWVLFTYHFPSRNEIGGSVAEERHLQRKSAAAELFPENSDTHHRRMFLVSKKEYFSRLAWLPDRLRSIKTVLNVLRGILVWRYRKFESAFPAIQTEIFEGIHDRISRRFLKCKNLAASIARTPLRTKEREVNCARIDCLNQEPRSLPTPPTQQCLERESLMSNLLSRAKTRELTVAGHPFEPYVPKSRKRKRGNDDDSSCIRPLRMPRCVVLQYQ